MIGYLQRFRHAPALDLDSACEDPIRVHPKTGATPGRCSGPNRCCVTTRLKKQARVETLLSRQRVEVAENDRWNVCSAGLRDDRFELGQLSVTCDMRIHMGIKYANLL